MVEHLEKDAEHLARDFERLVLQRASNTCQNCGSTERVNACLIVPIEAKGQYIESNGVALCRGCELLRDAMLSQAPSDHRKPVNLHVSRDFYNLLSNGLQTRNGFQSMSSVVRYLVRKFVVNEGRFDDLEQYQDEGSDVKINLWLDADDYSVFKVLARRRGLTITDAVKALVLMFANQTKEK